MPQAEHEEKQNRDDEENLPAARANPLGLRVRRNEAVDSLSLVKCCHHRRPAPAQPAEFQQARNEWQYQRRGKAEG
ncbi:hypothetical protein [Sinorhizobium psoraleae]|uniref:hypothetical protein n=1 Tax=Sinorhizobium psoraleae TaxID=520838 RepID=UPI00156A184C|nr:hypothetical protein [Sinorhizobium psoraleae]